MKLLRKFLNFLIVGRQARDTAWKKLEEIEREGGLRMPCGCFILMYSSDARGIAENTGPQELLQMVEHLEEGHLSECKL
jgi:hypothetical protein